MSSFGPVSAGRSPVVLRPTTASCPVASSSPCPATRRATQIHGRRGPPVQSRSPRATPCPRQLAVRRALRAAGDANRLRQLSHHGRRGRQQGPPITPRPRHRTPAGSRRTRGPRSRWPESCCSAGCWRAAMTCCWSEWQSSWASPPWGLTPSPPRSHLKPRATDPARARGPQGYSDASEAVSAGPVVALPPPPFREEEGLNATRGPSGRPRCHPAVGA